MKKLNPYLILLLLIAGLGSFLFPRCAKIVPPTGGPRDTIPPEVVRSTPANFSTGFTGSEIYIEFDEFIQLRNINEQFIITPPQKERPEFRARGRNLYIDIKTDPIPNTTYTLNFGEAIVDLNEGNALSNYEFVFSTGDIIDSLSYSGIVLNAADNQPVEGVVVMLYEILQDSVPYRQMPLYANRTGEEGRFQLNNLRADTFKVFALTDINNNYLYDRPGEEKIAFLKDYILPDTLKYESPLQLPHSPDTLDNLLHEGRDNNLPVPADSLAGESDPDRTPPDRRLMEESDTAQFEMPELNDTLNIKGDKPSEQKFAFGFHSGDTLFLFAEETGRQYISQNERNSRGELLFIFNLPLEKEWSIEPLNFDPPDNWKMVEKNPRNDSVRYWITDNETRNLDNMQFLVSYWATGPSDSLRYINDSLNMNYTPPLRSRRQLTDEDTELPMDITFGIQEEGTLELNKNLILSFPVPLSEINDAKTKLTTGQDNNAIPRNFELIQDSLRIRNYYLTTDLLPGQNYQFTALPGAFTDIYGLESDSIEFTFNTREEDHYSRIILNLTGAKNQIILQLLDEKDAVFREFHIDHDDEVIFDYLQPANYRLKAIFDINNNGKWDTGNYLKGIQPERVMFFREEIATRSNWDIEIEWDLDPETAFPQ
ncbi:MAG: Ig-like domain-containing protein [Bacteroidales bacterium]